MASSQATFTNSNPNELISSVSDNNSDNNFISNYQEVLFGSLLNTLKNYYEDVNSTASKFAVNKFVDLVIHFEERFSKEDITPEYKLLTLLYLGIALFSLDIKYIRIHKKSEKLAKTLSEHAFEYFNKAKKIFDENTNLFKDTLYAHDAISYVNSLLTIVDWPTFHSICFNSCHELIRINKNNSSGKTASKNSPNLLGIQEKIIANAYTSLFSNRSKSLGLAMSIVGFTENNRLYSEEELNEINNGTFIDLFFNSQEISHSSFYSCAKTILSECYNIMFIYLKEIIHTHLTDIKITAIFATLDLNEVNKIDLIYKAYGKIANQLNGELISGENYLVDRHRITKHASYQNAITQANEIEKLITEYHQEINKHNQENEIKLAANAIDIEKKKVNAEKKRLKREKRRAQKAEEEKAQAEQKTENNTQINEDNNAKIHESTAINTTPLENESDAAVETIDSNTNKDSPETQSNGFENSANANTGTENKSKNSQQEDDSIFTTNLMSFYNDGDYLEAIKLLKNHLPKKLKKAKTLRHFQLIYTLSECYNELLLSGRKLSSHTRNEYKELAENYREKALNGLQCHLLSMTGLEPDYKEWKQFFDVIKPNDPLLVDNTKAETSPKPTPQEESKPVNTIMKKEIPSAPMYVPLSDNVTTALYELDKHNIKNYLVGGSLRDVLLGMHPKDLDVAVDQPLNEVVKNLKIKNTIYGAHHPILKFKHSNIIIEISMLASKKGKNIVVIRENGNITHAKISDSITDDALLRDFTINALYYDRRAGKVYDPTGQGLKDIQDKVIRTIKHPNASFKEDPIRMLRAIRFKNRDLGLTIESETYKGICNSAGLLATAAPERIWRELEKFAQEGTLIKALPDLKETGILNVLFPKAYASPNSEKLIQAMGDKITAKELPKHLHLDYFIMTFIWTQIEKDIINKNKSIYTAAETILAKYKIILGLNENTFRNFTIMCQHALARSFDKPNLKLLNTYLTHPNDKTGVAFANFIQKNTQHLNNHLINNPATMWKQKKHAPNELFKPKTIPQP